MSAEELCQKTVRHKQIAAHTGGACSAPVAAVMLPVRPVATATNICLSFVVKQINEIRLDEERFKALQCLLIPTERLVSVYRPESQLGARGP